MSKTIYTKDPAKRFYVYAFLREDGTPYYIGKGTGNRAWSKSGRQVSPPTDSRIVILKETLTETEAFDEEKRLIQLHGRKDLGTGCLRNLTDGGEGASGCIRSQDTLDKMSGENHHNYGKTGEQSPMYGKTGEQSPRYGKKHTQDTKDKMSEAKTGKCQSAETIANKSGEKNPMYGKKQSAETRAKMSASMTGKKLSPESIAKREETKKRNREAKDLLQHQ